MRRRDRSDEGSSMTAGARRTLSSASARQLVTALWSRCDSATAYAEEDSLFSRNEGQVHAWMMRASRVWAFYSTKTNRRHTFRLR